MDILRIFTGNSKSTPKDVAKDRLQLILIHDRGNMSSELLERLKADILKVISNYAEFDCSDVDINLTTAEENDGNVPALVASIPIKNTRFR